MHKRNGEGAVFLFLVKKAFPIRSTVSSCFLLCPSTLEDLRFLKTYRSIKPLFFCFIAQIHQHEVYILRSSCLCSSFNGSTNHQKSMLHPSLSTPPIKKKEQQKTNQQKQQCYIDANGVQKCVSTPPQCTSHADGTITCISQGSPSSSSSSSEAEKEKEEAATENSTFPPTYSVSTPPTKRQCYINKSGQQTCVENPTCTTREDGTVVCV